jgi:hypothetical protein
MPFKDLEKRKLLQRIYARKYYEKNREEVIRRAKHSHKEMQTRWENFKATNFCEFCGYDHPSGLDFHHPPGVKKLGHVSDFLMTGAFKKAVAEANKCICLCSNCHRLLHHELRIAKQAEENKKLKKKKGHKAP